jgi:Xaa-Pro aminopeptidase
MAAKPVLEIAPEKVAHVIIKAREYDAKVGAWDASSEDGDAAEDPSAILEDLSDDPTAAEIAGFIDALNDDEQAHLVALAWIGRGTFEAEELAEAVETARSEQTNSTASYLLGLPLLSDYLEEGLEKLGFSANDIESDVL